MEKSESTETAEPTPINVLVVEDSENDVQLVADEMKRGGFAPLPIQVQTDAEMRKVLAAGGIDIVLCDYSLPTYSANEALALLRSSNEELPCIVVSGAIGEEAAASLMKAGADDFVMKHRLSRLVPAVRRCLRDAELRRAHRNLAEALAESQARFEALASNLPVMVFQTILALDGTAKSIFVSEGSRAVLGLEPEEILEKPQLLVEQIIPEDRESFLRSRLNSAKLLAPRNWEGRLRVRNVGDVKWINLRASTRKLPTGEIMSEGIITNITESKLAQEAMRRSREQIRQLASHVEKVKENERAHIAREVHDDLGATLTAAKIDLAFIRNRLPGNALELAAKTDEMEALLDEAIDATRRISRRLRPLILDHGITAAIEWQAKEFARRSGIRCSYFCANDEIPLDEDLSNALFRVFQETLTNVARHASASYVDVELGADCNIVTLAVQDDGRGMTPEDMQKVGSYGLRGMRERVDYLGGEISIDSQPKHGTRIEVRVPLHPTGHEQDQANREDHAQPANVAREGHCGAKAPDH